MTDNVFWKSAIRQPVRTLFLFLLIGAISFAFIANGVEYIVVRAETTRLGSYFQAIGYLIHEGGAQDVTSGADIVSRSQYVKFEDRRWRTSGVLHNMYNTDLSGVSSDFFLPGRGIGTNNGIHVSDMYVYGTVRFAWEFGRLGRDENDREVRRANAHEFWLVIDDIEAGFPEYTNNAFFWDENMGLHIRVIPELIAGDISWVNDIRRGQRYFIKARYNPWLATGDRVTFARDDYGNWGLNRSFLIQPLTADISLIPLEPGMKVDFANPLYKDIAEQIEVLNENIRTMAVTGTKDMSSMPYVQQDSNHYFLTRGRWLNREDDLEGRPVVVVRDFFASLRRLSIGDRITLTFRDLQNQDDYYIKRQPDSVPDDEWDNEDWYNWRDYPTHEETFEIVGIYREADANNFFEGSHNSIFMYVPESTMPQGFNIGPLLSSVNYSFVLNSTEDQEAFIAENRAALSDLGYRIEFSDNNAAQFWSIVHSLWRSKAINAVIYGVLLIFTLMLSSYIYLRQRRREYAIHRALGITQKQSLKELIFPIIVTGAAGIIIGGIPAWIYALRQAVITITDALGAYRPEAVSAIWLFVFCFCIFLLLVATIAIMARLITQKPVLALLREK